jgi:molybdopterin-guanine dinucleotide biosynthesis protein A
MSDAAIHSDDITGLVLAGGRGARMGGVDKGLQVFHGLPLAQHALQRLRPQVGALMVNANRNLEQYRALGAPVWPDSLADYAGPLAGFLTGLQHCQTPYLVTVPCDSPLFPLDLVARLAAALAAAQADVAMVSALEADAQGNVQARAQPVFCLLRSSLKDSLLAFTQQGGRKIDTWTAQHRTVLVPFDAPQDDPAAFFNANTLAELQALESGRHGPRDGA